MKDYLIAGAVLILAATQIPGIVKAYHFNLCLAHEMSESSKYWTEEDAAIYKAKASNDAFKQCK